jgi:hypothetical protein
LRNELEAPQKQLGPAQLHPLKKRNI